MSALTKEAIEDLAMRPAVLGAVELEAAEHKALCDMAMRSLTVESAIAPKNTARTLVLEDGKYEFYDDVGQLHCKRYGSQWRDFIGDHAVYALYVYARVMEERAAATPVAQEAVGIGLSTLDSAILSNLIAWCRGRENAMEGLKRSYIADRLESIQTRLRAAPVTRVPEGPFIAVGTVRGNGELTMYEREIPDGEHIVYIARKGSPVPEDRTKNEAALPSNVYFHAEHDNFYSFDGRGMGSAFYETWVNRRKDFPRSPMNSGSKS